MYERFNVSVTTKEADCGKVQCVNCDTLKVLWLCDENDFVKIEYEDRKKGKGVWEEKPPVRWISRENDVWEGEKRICQEGAKCAERDYWNRDSWKCFFCGDPGRSSCEGAGCQRYK